MFEAHLSMALQIFRRNSQNSPVLTGGAALRPDPRYSPSMKNSLAILLTLVAAAPASAETLLVDNQVQLRPSAMELPKRGSTMTTVEARFGAPANKHSPVGNPPITRWDYAGYSVYFEHQHVVHAVAFGS
jgi:hypothetical protein